MSESARVDQLREAMARGEAFTRLEACDRFGITGSTFRWAIKSMREAGQELDYVEVPGRRGSTLKRWRLVGHRRRSGRRVTRSTATL